MAAAGNQAVNRENKRQPEYSTRREIYHLMMLKNYLTILNILKNKVARRPLPTTRQKNLAYFAVHIVEQCNLKCKYCGHFAPLAQEEFADIKVFEKDFARLSELLKAKVDRIGLMGGEPLLHPQLNDFFYVARKYFPQTELQLVTNGILLLKQTEEFWRACKDNNIKIVNTKYPLPLDFGKIRKVAKKYDVGFKYHDTINILPKKSVHLPLDLEGKQDEYINFTKCSNANNYCFLHKGRLFTCSLPSNIRHFNNFFKKNIPLTNTDYVDIYKARSEEEVLDFLCRPIPFCRYCHVTKRTAGHRWQKSKKDISEWTV
jgi:hypothetical protein